MAGTRHRGLSLAAAAALNGTSARPAAGPKPGFKAPTGSAADDWRHRAACRDEDPELFYPLSFKGGPSMAQIDDAKTICRGCASRPSCFDWAMETGDDAGILGGTTPDERKAIKRRAARQRAQERTR